MKGCPGTPRTIVGVVGNHIDRQRAVLAPMVYVPYPSRAIEPTTLALRTAGDPRPLLPTIRRIVAGLGTRIDGDVTTGVEYKDSKFAQERLLAVLLFGFGSIALGVCSLGIYGLLTYTVSRRTPEIGLRMALGAQRADVIRLVFHESLWSVAAGIAVGLMAAFALTRLVESTLFGVSKHDPWTLAGAAIVLLLTATAAAFAPARRASRTDPMTALRYE
jgi:ABC-type antimicrobial peptide transport system permease subunit